MAGKNVEIMAFSTEGKQIGEYRSIKDAVEKLSIDQAAISRVLSGKANHAKGVVFLKSDSVKSKMQTAGKIIRFFQVNNMNINEFLKYEL